MNRSTALATAIAALSVSPAPADVQLLSRHSETRWIHTEFPPGGSGDWTDFSSFNGAGDWNITLPHGSTHHDVATANFLGGVFEGYHFGSRLFEQDGRTESMTARFAVSGSPTLASLSFSAHGNPIPFNATSSQNVILTITNVDTGQTIFDIFRDGHSLANGLSRTWDPQTWSASLAVGTYQLRVVGDQLDLDVVGGHELATGHIDFGLTLVPSPSVLSLVWVLAPATLRRRRVS